ncbi:MAG: VCBS repeat-containing protein [Candidatus Eisenbacteria bacterium]|uniref:VCBS repeat-containing protein n=1 Tax=Eiseniibacteriota bacterium TaxID=2212470 RepID=A0A933W2K2_UNCEI|nr:VCBS repeat-containing protein [Candidatus Eisenbacteria bacterium]
MKSRRLLVSLPLLALALSSLTAAAHAASPFVRAASPVRTVDAALATGLVPQRETVAYLGVDEAALAEFRSGDGGTLELPAPDGSTLSLELARVDVLAPGATITFTDDAGSHAYTPDVVCFRGTIAGESGSWAALTLTADGALGVIETHGEQLQLAPVAASIAGGRALHALSPATNLASAASTFTCGVNESTEAELDPAGPQPRLPRAATPNGVQIDAPRKVFAIAVDCDYELYTTFSSNLANATAYVVSLMNVVSLIYERDLEATLNVSYLNFWSTVSDPYTQSTTGTQLPEFRNWWNSNRSFVPRSLATLLSARPLGGGIAYINQLCSGSLGYSVSAIDAAYSYPTNTSTWDATVVAHELGHNFGSYHTHSCNWQSLGYLPTNALIDSCQAGEEGCIAPTLHVPPDKGTIMSYCHLLAGGQTNIRLDFHPICIDYMRARINAAGCATTPAPLPPRTPSIAAIATGARVSWVAGGSTGVTGYSVWRSRTMLDAAPQYRGFTTGLTFDDTEMGTFYYKVRTVRAADSSSFSAEVKLNLCPLASSPNVSTGSAPIATATADLDHDGDADLVVANSGSTTVSVLRGNGNGTFAAGVAYAAAGTPACVAISDVDLDGDPDLLVGTQADSALWVLRGNGDGTFAAGVRTPLNAQPSGIAIADFDEDGADDLAIAGSLGGLLTLRGHTTAGVPDGTFEAPVVVPVSAQTRQVIVGDFNEDGIWDLATTASGLKVLLGQGSGGVGDGTFGAAASYNAGGTPWDLASADFNLDGIADLAVANSGASSVSMFLGAGSGGVGNGTFPVSGTSVSVNSNPRGLVVTDWNGDGVPDLAVANSSTTAKTMSMLTGKGDGTFNAAVTSAANTKAWAIALGDFNGDGGADLAVVNNGTNTATIWRAGCGSAAALGVTTPAGGDTWIATQQRTIVWTRTANVTHAHVELSRDGGTTWQRLASHVPGTAWTWTVTGAGTSTARVRVIDAARQQVIAQSAADFTIVPASALAVEDDAAARFGVRGVWPNPARGAISVTFALPQGGAHATLELIDLAGRRVVSRDLSALGAGVHTLPLAGPGAASGALRPGMYVVRLARPGQVSSAKVAVLR